jgi:3-dehydroquinate synthase
VITDRNVATIQAIDAPASLFADAPTLIVPSGEESKSIPELGRALDFLAAQGLDRSGAVFAVGGGVVGDLAGFAAASYLRGIDYYQVPTTLLSMVDSSVGGKTGINLKAGKNLAGAFHQPRGVFIATGFPQAASAPRVRGRHGRGDQDGAPRRRLLFEDLERSGPERRATCGSRGRCGVCCGIKARLVEADERELAEGAAAARSSTSATPSGTRSSR